MANTRQNVSVTQGAWLNLNTSSGVAVGTTCTIYNKGSQPANIAISVAAPTDVTGTFGIPLMASDRSVNSLVIPTGANAVWGWTPTTTSAQPALILVQD